MALDIIAATSRYVTTLTGPAPSDLASQLQTALVAAGWTSQGYAGDGSYKMLSQQSPWQGDLDMPPDDYIAQCMLYINNTGSALSVRAGNASATALQDPTRPCLMGNAQYFTMITAYSLVMYRLGDFSGGQGSALAAGVPFLPIFQAVRGPRSPEVQEAIYCADISNFRLGLGTPIGPQFCCYQSAKSTSGAPAFWTRDDGGDLISSFQVLGLDNLSSLAFDGATFTDATKWAPLFTPLRVMWGNSPGANPTLKGFLFDGVYCSKEFPGDDQIMVDPSDPTVVPPTTFVMNVMANNNAGGTGPRTLAGTILIASAGGTYTP